jgi:hypothetical protein
MEVETLNEQISTILQQNTLLIDENKKLRATNEKIIQEIKLTQQVNSNHSPFPVAASMEDKQSRSYLGAASLNRVATVPTPANSVGLASASFDTFNPLASPPYKFNSSNRILFPLQIETVESFQNCEELRSKLLRPMAFENKLPKIKNLSAVK